MRATAELVRRWPKVGIALMVIVCALTVLDAFLWAQRSSDHNRIALLAQKEASAQRYIAAQKRAQKALRVAKKLADQSSCRAAIKGTKIANVLVLNIRGTDLALARVATNLAVKKELRERAAVFHAFPVPKCDPGPPLPKKKGSEG